MTMILQGWLPPSRENWELVVSIFQWFPLITILQWLQITESLWDWYPMGKTSTPSRFNIPGKLGWATMETPGYLLVLYCVYSLPQAEGIGHLPFANKIMASVYTLHYIYRSIIFAYLSPSISSMSPILWLGAVIFNIANGLSIGGWLGAYGPTTDTQWRGTAPRVCLGLSVWAAGWALNIWHDDELREIRRAAARIQKKRLEARGEDAKRAGKGVEKVYMVPDNGLFKIVLFPHYLTEWVEWCGFWIVGGLHCVPARIFLVNEVSTMLPRAVQGKKWYVKRFGKEKVGTRQAVIPGLV